MLVRLAIPADAEAVSHVHVEAWRVAYAGLLPSALLASLDVERRLAYWSQELMTPQTPGNMAWVLEVDGIVVGFANLGPCRDADRQQSGDWELFAIYLLADQWGRGRGRALALTALQAVPEHCTSLTLWVLAGNDRAIRFYESLGFTPDGMERQEVLGGDDVREIRLLLKLSRLQ